MKKGATCIRNEEVIMIKIRLFTFTGLFKLKELTKTSLK